MTVGLCACTFHPTPGELMARAMIEPTPNLCAVVLLSQRPDEVKAAEDEISSRHATCNWDEARAVAQTQIAQKQAEAQAQEQADQARQANLMNALAISGALLQQSGPHYYSPPPAQTTCVQQGIFMHCNSY